MAYSRRYILQRIVSIQEITLEHTRRGVSQEYVYQNFIKPVYHISRRTFYRYLGEEFPRKQIREIRNKELEELEELE
ncbi:MAG: hypothetical protein PWQ06_2022 [Anaerophaga sp.]|nr:hypothetical protein [Anaerophaga sp.]